MKCFYCNAEVIWQSDYDAEDINEESEYTIVSMYDCKECNSWYEVYSHKKGEKWAGKSSKQEQEK